MKAVLHSGVTYPYEVNVIVHCHCFSEYFFFISYLFFCVLQSQSLCVYISARCGCYRLQGLTGLGPLINLMVNVYKLTVKLVIFNLYS